MSTAPGVEQNAEQAAQARSWKPGHNLRLLENGEEFFPRVFEAIGAAKREVLIETFILFQDKIGNQLHAAVIDAARRGVRVELTVDGYGSPDLSQVFVAAMTDAGVTLHIFDPQPKLLGMRTNIFRRLHRKLIVIDRERASSAASTSRMITLLISVRTRNRIMP